MTDDAVSAEVRQFLFECIDSVAQLEALLLLRESPRQGWDISELARRLYIDEAEAAGILNGLVTCGLAVTDGGVFRYHTRDDAHQQLVDNVALTYARYLVPVTKLIHDKSLGIRKFADAFKFRKDR